MLRYYLLCNGSLSSYQGFQMHRYIIISLICVNELISNHADEYIYAYDFMYRPLNQTFTRGLENFSQINSSRIRAASQSHSFNNYIVRQSKAHNFVCIFRALRLSSGRDSNSIVDFNFPIQQIEMENSEVSKTQAHKDWSDALLILSFVTVRNIDQFRGRCPIYREILHYI